jgi:hypothetical protein
MFSNREWLTVLFFAVIISIPVRGMSTECGCFGMVGKEESDCSTSRLTPRSFSSPREWPDVPRIARQRKHINQMG